MEQHSRNQTMFKIIKVLMQFQQQFISLLLSRYDYAKNKTLQKKQGLGEL